MVDEQKCENVNSAGKIRWPKRKQKKKQVKLKWSDRVRRIRKQKHTRLQMRRRERKRRLKAQTVPVQEKNNYLYGVRKMAKGDKQRQSQKQKSDRVEKVTINESSKDSEKAGGFNRQKKGTAGDGTSSTGPRKNNGT